MNYNVNISVNSYQRDISAGICPRGTKRADFDWANRVLRDHIRRKCASDISFIVRKKLMNVYRMVS